MLRLPIASPANDYWFAPRPHIGTQLPAALFTLHSPLSGPLPRSTPSFFSQKSTHLLQEDEIFFAPCKLLAYGEMNATLAGGLGNILRADLVCI